MTRRIRGAVIVLAAIAIAVGITACMNWFTSVETPTLLLGEVTIIGDRGEILLSAKDMPGGGLASLAVVLGGIAYKSDKVSDVSVEGLLGFIVVAQEFDSNDGGFLLAHSCSGLFDGVFAKIVFTATGNPTLADFTVTAADISMEDDSGNAIAFDLGAGFEFYAK